jgi:hypothetical protein
MKPTILFSIAGLSLLTVVATPAQLNEQGVDPGKQRRAASLQLADLGAVGPNPGQPL